MLLFLEVIAPIILLYIYYQNVNFPWLQEQLVTAMTDEQKRGAIKLLSKQFLIVSSTVALAFTIPILTALFALYFYLVGKVSGMAEGFRDWFAMVTWASAPSILALPIGLISIFLSQDGRFRPEETNPLTLNQLFAHLSTESPWRGILESANVIVLLVVLLMGLGFANWARVSVPKGLAIGIVPYGAIYLTWFVIILATFSG